jgi:hypothetical protein
MSTTGNPENQSAINSAENDTPKSHRGINDASSDQPLQYNETTATEHDGRNDVEPSNLDNILRNEKKTSRPADAQGVHVEEQPGDSGPGTLLEKTVTSVSDKPYSVFTPRQKRFIILASSIGTFISPLTSAIYFPALNTIASDLHVSISQINLTITIYMVIMRATFPPRAMQIQPVLINAPDLPGSSAYLHW